MNNEGKRVERQESAGLPQKKEKMTLKRFWNCLLYTSDAADE